MPIPVGRRRVPGILLVQMISSCLRGRGASGLQLLSSKYFYLAWTGTIKASKFIWSQWPWIYCMNELKPLRYQPMEDMSCWLWFLLSMASAFSCCSSYSSLLHNTAGHFKHSWRSRIRQWIQTEDTDSGKPTAKWPTKKERKTEVKCSIKWDHMIRFPDPWRFETDPNPPIRTLDYGSCLFFTVGAIIHLHKSSQIKSH